VNRIASVGSCLIIGWRLQCHPGKRLKIGGGTPANPDSARLADRLPRWSANWRIRARTKHNLCYSAGVMVLSKEHPQVIRYRSVEPVLRPTLPQECSGTVAHVVFPTGIDRRDDLGLPNRFDVYYGMADSRIGVARLDMPDFLTARRSRRTPRKQRCDALGLVCRETTE